MGVGVDVKNSNTTKEREVVRKEKGEKKKRKKEKVNSVIRNISVTIEKESGFNLAPVQKKV